jgi:hypothetical protein
MYKRIAEQKAQLDKYVEKLIAEGTFTKEVLTVADHVNDNVTLELGTPVSSDLADVVDSLSIVGREQPDWFHH